ncbi:DNA-binding FadR family transcriptional regulator [Streptacidiphilus sp. MAP12-16]|uniref:FadR/GntR family transcriptional regulator n=1 Tax=Streptacidiphilus sp. MAP12-16 TaxID=3156300 RepID=UPI003513E8F9
MVTTTASVGQNASALGLDSPAMAGIRRLKAIDTVRARIGMAVDLGLLAPGERLPPVDQIARAMDVSEITVRRAMVSLGKDGLLERRRGRNGGTLVCARPPHGAVPEAGAYSAASEEVHDLIDRRLLLECGVAHLAAGSVTGEQLQRLDRLVEAMDAAADWAVFHAADAAFHLTVAEATGVPSAARHYGDVLRELYRYYLPYPMDYLRSSNNGHRELLSALTNGDAGTAGDCAHRHVEVLHRTMFMGLPSLGTPAQ